jgi:hypothetical protein
MSLSCAEGAKQKWNEHCKNQNRQRNMGQAKADAFNPLVSMKTEWRLKGCPEREKHPELQ